MIESLVVDGMGNGKNVVSVVIVCNKEVLLAINGAGWQGSGAISVKGAGLFVGEGCKAEDVGWCIGWV